VRRRNPSVLLLGVDGVLQFRRAEFAASMAADYQWRDSFDAFQRELFALVFLATNQEPLRGSFLQRRYASYPWCTGVFLSCRIGAAMPDRRFFTYVLEDLRQPATECLLVDAAADACAAAGEQGWHAIRFTGNEQLAAAIDGL
jgi:FMN phosphatase YigB (HAD superfamily)